MWYQSVLQDSNSMLSFEVLPQGHPSGYQFKYKAMTGNALTPSANKTKKITSNVPQNAKSLQHNVKLGISLFNVYPLPFCFIWRVGSIIMGICLFLCIILPWVFTSLVVCCRKKSTIAGSLSVSCQCLLLDYMSPGCAAHAAPPITSWRWHVAGASRTEN